MKREQFASAVGIWKAWISLSYLLAYTSLPAATIIITDGTFGVLYNANTNKLPDTYLVEENKTRVGTHNGEVIALGKNDESHWLTVKGSVINTNTTGSNARAIRTADKTTNTYTVSVESVGKVQAYFGDAIKARRGTFNLDNSGTIYAGSNLSGSPSATTATGQALDLEDATGGTVTNQTGGLIQADGHDAVRAGSNMALINYGTILGNGVINDGSANNVFNTAPLSTDISETYSSSEGVSFENSSNSSLENYGTVSGSRHGVESGTATNITITNRGTGQLIGRNGSGIGFDTTSTSASNVKIYNYGLIRGDCAVSGQVYDRTGALSPTQDGDGDGVDIDGAATIVNYEGGQILGNGARGYDTGGRANSSEGIAFGGGSVVNYGLIRGASRGILVNNDTVVSRSGVAATDITNYANGRIEGKNGFAIRLENKTGTAADHDSITNYGTIIGTGSIPDPSEIVLRQNGLADPNSTGTLDGVVYTGTGSARFIRGDGSAIQMGEGDDILINYGTIQSSNGRAVNMEGGNDAVTIHSGSVIQGLINGGAGTDTLTLHLRGLTPEKKAALEAGQTVSVRGVEFSNFEIVSGSSTSVSYESLAAGGKGQGVARAIDQSAGQAGAEMLKILDELDARADTAKALEELTPLTYQGLTSLSFNQFQQVTNFLGQRLVQSRAGLGGGADVSGLRLWDPAIAQSLQQTRYMLAGISPSSDIVSTDPIPMPAPMAGYHPDRWGLFVNGGMTRGEQEMTSSLPKSHYTTGTVVAGLDYAVAPWLTWGAFTGYSNTDANLDSLGSKSLSDTVLGGSYVGLDWNRFFADLTFTFGRTSYENKRVALGSNNSSNPTGDSYSWAGTFGYEHRAGHWHLAPQVGLQWTQTEIGAYDEIGAAALQVQEDTADSLRSEVGGNIGYDLIFPWGKLTPSVHSAWHHEFQNNSRDIKASFVDAAFGSFTSSTENPDRDFAVSGVGMNAAVGKGWTLHTRYDVELGREKFIEHQIHFGARLAF